MKTGIIIQARKGSTRLPNKMVLPFYEGRGVLELLIEKMLIEFPKEMIVLATTNNDRDEELVIIAKQKGIKYYRGSENNVLNRFIEASVKFKYTNIIRVCADNPFLDIPHIHILIKEIESGKYDYVSYKTKNGLPTIKSHLGLFTEAVTLKALHKVNKLTKQSLYQEHVTNYIYESMEMFKIELLDLPIYMENTNSIRLTLDTSEDFDLEKELYSKFKKNTTEDLIQNLLCNEEVLKKMRYSMQKTLK